MVACDGVRALALALIPIALAIGSLPYALIVVVAFIDGSGFVVSYVAERGALRQLVAQGHGGAVVNNASVLGWRAQPGQAHYAAAKAGVMALTRCAALDVAAHGIRVNAVAPSLAVHPFLAKVTSEDLLAELAAAEPFGRAAQPWEVANVIVFLASDYASYMTGEVVSVSAQHP